MHYCSGVVTFMFTDGTMGQIFLFNVKRESNVVCKHGCAHGSYVTFIVIYLMSVYYRNLTCFNR